MLAQKNEYLQDVVSGVRQLTEDEKIRQRCQAREDYEYWEHIRTHYYQSTIQQQDETIQQQGETIQQQGELLRQKDAQLAEALAKIADLEATK